MRSPITPIGVIASALLLTPFAQAAEPGLASSVRTWDGEYASRHVPGGVESTPTVGAIGTANADGTGLKRIIPPGLGTDCPAAGRDGKWVYYQSGGRGKTRVHRCKWDGTGTAGEVRSLPLFMYVHLEGEGGPWPDTTPVESASGRDVPVIRVTPADAERVEWVDVYDWLNNGFPTTRFWRTARAFAGRKRGSPRRPRSSPRRTCCSHSPASRTGPACGSVRAS